MSKRTAFARGIFYSDACNEDEKVSSLQQLGHLLTGPTDVGVKLPRVTVGEILHQLCLESL